MRVLLAGHPAITPVAGSTLATEHDQPAMVTSQEPRLLVGDGILAAIPTEGIAPREPEEELSADPPSAALSLPTLSLSPEDTFRLHSRPGSNFTIYLDFDGNVTEGTPWNSSRGIDTIVNPPYDLDGDPLSFSTTELNRVLTSWQRVAEDFAPFDVNVTTEDPGTEALRNSGAGDTQWGVRVVVTDDTFADCGCGGHARIGSFDSSVDTPAFVYNSGQNTLPETITHEVGHTINLSHDGTSDGNTTVTYYSGHGSGETGWGSIMGAPFSKNVTTWDIGEYFNANNGGSNANYTNGPDDLDVATTTSGFGYRDDDYGDSPVMAEELQVSNGVDVSAFGIIERNTDVDFFSFETGAGLVSFALAPLSERPNLDIWAGIYDLGGSLLAQANPSDELSATLTDVSLDAGTYFLKVDGVGSHGVYNPATDSVEDPSPGPWESDPPEGYSQYGSLGQYSINGTVVSPGPDTFSISATDATKKEGDGSTTSFEFTVTRSGNTTLAASVDFHVAAALPTFTGDNYPLAVTGADFDGGSLPNGNIPFLATETAKTISIDVAGDTVFERDEFFDVVLSNASAGWTLADSTARGTIESDENQLSVSPGFQNLTARNESDPYAGLFLRWRQVSHTGNSFDEWAIDNVTLSNSTFADDFDPTTDDSQWKILSNGTANADFGGSGNSLKMSGDGDRLAMSRIVSPTAGDLLSFDLIFGDGTNGGDNAEDGEDVVLEYSTDGGGTWSLVNVYDTENYTTWTTIQETMPTGLTVDETAYTFTVTRDGDDSVATTVDWQVDTTGLTDPAAIDDFVGGVLASGQITFAPSQNAQGIEVFINKDLDVEPDERFTFRLLNPASPAAVSLAPQFETGQGIILNDEATVLTQEETLFRWRQVTFSGDSFDEWALDNVHLTNSAFADDFDPAVDDALWSEIINGTANTNFGGDGNSLFMSGEDDRWATSVGQHPDSGDVLTFDLIFGDGTNGGDDAENGEDVVLEYSVDGSNWTDINTYDTEAHVIWTTIQESVPPEAESVVPTLAEGDTGDTTYSFHLHRSGYLDKGVTVDWHVVGSGSDPADGADFNGGDLPSGTLTFDPGQTSKFVEILVSGDAQLEADESFDLVLSNSTGGPLGDPVTATILNDDLSTANAEWAVANGQDGTGSGATGADDEGRQVALDADGNVYVVGSRYFIGSANNGDADIFVTKYSPQGALIWDRLIGGIDDDRGRDIAVDSAGNVFVTGYFSETVDFDPGSGTDMLSSAGTYDIFVLKLDTAGNHVWAQRYGQSGGNWDRGAAIDVDADGNVFVTGIFGGSVEFAPGQPVAAQGSVDVFVLKLDAGGNYLWAGTTGGTDFDAANSIHVDDQGNVWTVGYVRGLVDFDPSPAGTANFTAGSSGDGFIWKLDNNGQFVWAGLFAGEGFDAVSDVASDTLGHVYVSGRYQSDVDFDPDPIDTETHTSTQHASGAFSFDAYVVKLHTSGDFVWVRTIGDIPPGGGVGEESAPGVAVDLHGNPHVVGAFDWTVDFDPSANDTHFESASSTDGYVLALTSAGSLDGVRAVGSAEPDMVNDVAMSADGRAVVTGYFADTAAFGQNVPALTSTGGTDAFVATLTVAPVKQQWDVDASGAWDLAANWNAGVVPNGAGWVAVLGDAVSAPRFVYTEQQVTLQAIEFNSSHPYAVGGLASIILDGGGSSARLTVGSGDHQFQAPVELATDVHVDVGPGSLLTFNNALSLNGNEFVKRGTGDVVVNNRLSTGGGSVIIQEGTVTGDGSIGGDVHNDGGTISPGNATGHLAAQRAMSLQEAVFIKRPGPVNQSPVVSTSTMDLESAAPELAESVDGLSMVQSISRSVPELVVLDAVFARQGESRRQRTMPAWGDGLQHSFLHPAFLEDLGPNAVHS